MHVYPFCKKPAFFPFVSAEVFFEADESNTGDALITNEALDSELDKILGLDVEAEEAVAASSDNER